MSRPGHYHRHQLILHWMTVLVVIMQYLFNGAMQRAYATGLETGVFPLDGSALMHAVGGSLILVFMLWRLTLRFTHGTPPPPDSEPGWMQVVSRGTHWTFYAVLLAMPLTGMTAVLTLEPVWGTAHEWLRIALLVLIVMHVSGALLHAFRKDSDAHRRMLRADPPQTPATGPGTRR